MRRLALLVGWGVLVLTLAATTGAEDEDERPWSEQPYLGLSVRDTEQGLVVGWVRPGPLRGTGFESDTGIQRGDNVVSVDGEAVDAARFKAHVKTKSPGDEVVLVYRRSPDAKADSAVPQGGEGGAEKTLEVVLGARADWAGTIGRGLGDRAIPPAAEGAFEAILLEKAGELGIRVGDEGVGGGLDVLLPYLAKIQEKALDPNALPAVVQAFRRPLSVDAVEARIAEAAQAAAEGNLDAVAAFVRAVLDLPASESPEAVEPAALRIGGRRLVRTLRDSVYIYDEHAESHVKTIAGTAAVGIDKVLALPLTQLVRAPDRWEAQAKAHADGEPVAEVPEEVRAAVQGDVLWFEKDASGHLAVVGGTGENAYDMSRVAAVYDLGGNDVYEYGESDTPVALRLVLDLAGDDVHASAVDFEGPATAVWGLSLVDDRAGNDVYRTKGSFGIGAGLYGIGVLLDRKGDDVYENLGPSSGWAMGVGFYGAGLIVDLGGHDVYRGEKLVQGVGGPRGLGAILDAKGRDLYEANGPSFGSAYGTPAVHVGMSQGFGIGVRGYAAGGVGAIYDLAGNDRYEAGEFSQAGGYYFGLGILHDVAGHDLYYGNRYGQSFSAHQAVGILIDDAGDDTYWSMTAASQAGTWDQSIGLLLDRAGHDAYRCDGLGQGGASMQAIALLVDLGGNDRYSGAGRSIQGQGGGNRYHYDADEVFSFSALLDRGGGHDTYSGKDRQNDVLLRTGEYKPKNPGNSSLYGMFLDD